MNTPVGAIIRDDLAGAAMSYNAAQAGLVATKLLPLRRSTKRNIEFYRVPPAHFLRLESTKRRPKAARQELEAARVRDTFYVEEYTLEDVVDTADDSGTNTVEQDETSTATRLAGTILRDYERDVANAIFNTTTFPLSGDTGLSVSTPWATAASATPIDDVMRGHRSIINRTGQKPNTLVITQLGLHNLSRCDQIISRIRNVSTDVKSGVLPLTALATLFDVDRVLIARGRRLSSNVAVTSVTTAGLWDDDNAFLCYAEMSEDLTVPQIGRTFYVDPDPVPGADPLAPVTIDQVPVNVFEYPTPKTRGRTIAVEAFLGAKIIEPATGYLFGNLD